MLKFALVEYLERHWSKLISIDDRTGCHIWTGATSNGHPHASFLGKTLNPRRVLFAVHNDVFGKLPHLKPACGNALCVNPAHCGPHAAVPVADAEIQAALERARERMFSIFREFGTNPNTILASNPMLDREQVEQYLKEYIDASS